VDVERKKRRGGVHPAVDRKRLNDDEDMVVDSIYREIIIIRNSSKESIVTEISIRILNIWIRFQDSDIW